MHSATDRAHAGVRLENDVLGIMNGERNISSGAEGDAGGTISIGDMEEEEKRNFNARTSRKKERAGGKDEWDEGLEARSAPLQRTIKGLIPAARVIRAEKGCR